MASQKYGQSLHFMVQQILGALAGFAVIAFLVSVKKDFFLEPRFVYGLLGFTGLLLALCLVMPSVANTNRWIVLPGFRFQPSELAKISLILFLADVHREPEGQHQRQEDAGRARGRDRRASSPHPARARLRHRGPDRRRWRRLVLFLGGVKLRYLAAPASSAGSSSVFYLVQADYRIDRIQGFLASDKDARRATASRSPSPSWPWVRAGSSA